MKSFLLLVFTQMILIQAQASDPSWLLKITGQYIDEKTRQIQTLTGTGTLVSIDSKCFALTAAHALGQRNTTITSGDNRHRFETVSLLSNAAEDTALIELNHCGSGPLATWNPQRKLFVIKKADTEDWLTQCHFFCSDNNKPRLVQAGAMAVTVQAQWVSGHAEDWIIKDIEHHSATSEGLEFYLSLASRNWGNFFTTYTGKQISTDIKILPGMSGGPLIQNLAKPGKGIFIGPNVKMVGYVSNEDPFILGIVQRYMRDFEKSFFSSPEAIADLVKSYQSGQRHTLGQVTWKLRNTLLYRDYGDGTIEINPTDEAGSALSAVADGNGISGGGTGNGLSSGGSNDGFPGEELNSSETAFKKFGISPGILWQGKQRVVAFKVTNPAAFNGSLYLDANWATLEYFKSLSESYSVEPVYEGTPFKALIDEKIKHGIESKWRKLGSTQWTESCYMDKNSLNKGKLKLSVPMPSAHENKVLELDFSGRVISPDTQEFIPVLTLNSKNGLAYKVDIRGLFYTDLTLLPRLILPPVNPAYEPLTRISRAPYLIIQSSRSKSTWLPCEPIEWP